MTTPLPPPPDDLDPDTLAELGAMFMNAKLLCVGSQIGVFEHLGDGPRTLEELGAVLSIPLRSLRVVLNGLAAMGVLEVREGSYSNGRAAQAFMAGKTSVDVRPGLRLFNQLMYPMWMGFENAVRTGQPARHGKPSEDFAKIFSEGIEAWTGPGARALPRSYDFSQHRRVLDVGGGTGSYLLPLLKMHPGLRGTIYELPPSADAARRRLETEPARDRIEIVEGDVLFDPLPRDHDVVLIAALIHLFDPDKVQMVFRRVRDAMVPGNKLLVIDQWMDTTHTKPAFGAMLAGTYLMLSGEGDTYSVAEARPWFEASGFRFLEHKPLAGVTSLVVAEAV